MICETLMKYKGKYKGNYEVNGNMEMNGLERVLYKIGNAIANKRIFTCSLSSYTSVFEAT